MWRKTRSRVSGSTCRGIDPNRNWDAEWGSESFFVLTVLMVLKGHANVGIVFLFIGNSR